MENRRCKMWFFLFLMLQQAAASEFAPTNFYDWFRWHLGLLPDWGADSIAIPTPLGNMQAWTFGKKGSKKVALTLHGGMDTESVHREFNFIARDLARNESFFVISPNWHSLKAVKGKMTPSQLSDIMDALAKWAGVKNFRLVLGKGWGAAMAARVSASKPTLMDKLVMIGPGPLRADYGPQGNLAIPVPALLIVANDDGSLERGLAEAIVQNSKDVFQPHYWTHKGGHKIKQKYSDDIFEWIRYGREGKPVAHHEEGTADHDHGKKHEEL